MRWLRLDFDCGYGEVMLTSVIDGGLVVINSDQMESTTLFTIIPSVFPLTFSSLHLTVGQLMTSSCHCIYFWPVRSFPTHLPCDQSPLVPDSCRAGESHPAQRRELRTERNSAGLLLWHTSAQFSFRARLFRVSSPPFSPEFVHRSVTLAPDVSSGST